MSKQKDLLDPKNTPSNIKQGKELSKLAPTLIFIIFALIAVSIITAIMRRGPATGNNKEEVETVTIRGTPIGEDSVGEIESEKEKTAYSKKESIEIKELKEQIKKVSASKEKVELQKNIYWEKYKENQLQNGQAKQERLLAAVTAESTVSGGVEAAEEDEVAVDPYDKIRAIIESGGVPSKGMMPAGYDGAGYADMSQQLLQNQLAMVSGLGGNDNQNMQDAKEKFFNKSFSEGDYNDLPFKKVAIKSKYTLKEGSLIDGLMISGINSNLPGEIIATVSKDIYDSVTGKILLIPQGTELVGRYSSLISYAQDRVAFGWTRMNFENGDSINLGNMSGVDQEGYSGVKDQVNNHYVRLFGQIALVSFFQAVPALINPTESSSSQDIQTVTTTQDTVAGTDENGDPIIVTLTKTEPITTTSSSSSGGEGDEFQSQFKESYGQIMAQTGVELAKRNMSIQPTLNIRPGYKFKIIVTQDMILPPTAM